MGSDTMQDGTPPIENFSSDEVEVESNNINSLEVAISMGGDVTRELRGVAEILTRMELDLACSSEKLVNLDLLVMHVASRENDFEAFALEDEPKLEDSAEKALEFDFLCGFLDAEVREVDDFLTILQSEVVNCRGVVSSTEQLGDAFMEMEEKLLDCEESLKRSFEQVSDIKLQSANFRRILFSSSGDEKRKDDKDLGGLENGNLSDFDTKIKMQTSEQQRHILRMLEKSLARELDLEKRLTESKQTKEDLKLRLQQEVISMEEEAEDIWERLFEAENSVEIFWGISKELSSRLQIAQFNINEASEREGELRSNLQDLTEKLKEKDCALHESESSQTKLVEKVSSLELKVKELDSEPQQVREPSERNKEAEARIVELMEKASEAEKRAHSAETECKLLRDSNLELNKELALSKTHISDATERMELLERQYKDSEVKRQHAEASAEASEEKQHMLDCTIADMENLIKDLKAKIMKTDGQTESAEEKCIILSETNAELLQEMNFLRSRIKCLEMSLEQAEEANKTTAKDIRARSEFIADLIMQLALERERLHKKISSLANMKKVAVRCPQLIIEDPSITSTENNDAAAKEFVTSENAIRDGITKHKVTEKIIQSRGTLDEIDIVNEDLSKNEVKMDNADTVRNIDASQLNFRYFLVLLVLLVPPFAAFLLMQ